MDWDFIANGAVDVIDIVPEAFRGYYEEDKANGKYVVKADIKPLAEAYTGANKKLSTFGKQKKDDNAKDAARRVVIEGITAKLAEAGIEVGEDVAKLPDLISEKFNELLTQVKGGKEVKTNLEAIKADFNKRLAAELAKKDGEIQVMSSSLQEFMVDAEASRALAEAGTVEKGTDLLLPQISKVARVVKDDNGKYTVRVVDADNNVRLNNRGEPMSIKDVVAEMKTSYPMAFKSAAPSGGGKPPGTGKQPIGQPMQRRETEKSSVDKISSGLANLGRR